MQPDGSVQYHKLEYNSSSLNLSLNQYIPFNTLKLDIYKNQLKNLIDEG
jgi:hypothetical protein